VSVDSAEGDGLRLALDVLHKDVFTEAAVVGMIMLDLDAHGASVSLEGMFCHERLCRVVCFLNVDKTEPTVMVDEDGRIVVTLYSEPSLHLTDESRDCRLELVDRNDLPGHGGFEQFSVFWAALDSPRDL
jgi:hypothetical protein